MEVPEADEGKCKRIRNYIGVYLRSTGKWVAEFRDNKIGVRKWLGTFDTAEDAAMAFDKFSLKFYGHKGKLNFPERATHEADLQHVSHPTGNETRKKGSTCKHAEEAGRAYDKAALKKQNRNGQKERLNFLDREVNSHVSCAHSVEFVTSAEGICKTSGNYIGVHLRSTGKWGAEFRDNKIGVRKWLGTFNTAEDAAMAFDKASLKFHGHKAKLNFPGRATHEVDPQHASHPTGNETRKKCMSVQIARTHDSNKNGDVGLGTFKPAEEVAEMAYDKAALKKQNRNGQKARLNFPDGEVDSHVYVDQFVTSDAKRKRASQSSPGKRTRTKYIGVHQESSGMWRAQIRDPIKCASVRLGTFGTAEAAAMAFDEAALKLRGCKASLNFPDRDAASYRPSKRNCDSQSGAKSTFLSDKGQNHQSFLELPQHEHQNVVQPESSSQPNENYVLSSFWGDLSELDSYLERDRAISSMIDALKEAIQRAFRCKN